MEPIKLSKSFKYENTEAGKGAIFQGALMADRDALYLIHNKHSWESAAIAVQFGPLGMLIHHLFTKKKTVEYPFPTLPASEVSADLKATLGLQSFKDTAEVSIIPKDQVQGYSKSTFKGTRFKVGDVQILLTGAVGKAIKQLPDLGYAEL